MILRGQINNVRQQDSDITVNILRFDGTTAGGRGGAVCEEAPAYSGGIPSLPSFLVQKEYFERHWTPEPFSGCWLWTGEMAAKGYGRFVLKNSGLPTKRAHRVAWILYRGAIPDGLQVCHKCDVRLCVNPDHLFLGTNLDNALDAIAKGRIVAKLSPDEVRYVRSSDRSNRSLARTLGVSEGTIQDTKRGLRYAYIPQ